MPIHVHIPARELYDPVGERFVTVKETDIVLEHSLISIAKWESKWHKAYLSTTEKTQEEVLDYLRCMCLTKTADPSVFYALDAKTVKEIADYINNPMTATTIRRTDQRKNHKIITNEVIYSWMVNYGIPFDPCEKWHLNRLLMLVEVLSVENQPPKKMATKDMLNQRAALNAQRRAKYKTRG